MVGALKQRGRAEPALTDAERTPSAMDCRAFYGPRRLLALFGLSMLALVGIWQFVAALQMGVVLPRDFAQDYLAAESAIAGRSPYHNQNDRLDDLFEAADPTSGPHYSNHPPPSLIFFVPLTLLPYSVAFGVWGLIQLFCLWMIVIVITRALSRSLSWLTTLAITAGLIVCWPIRENFVEGQLNIPLAVGITTCWYGMRAGRPVLGGVALATSFALKPLASLIILWAVWRRKWKLVGTAAVGFTIYGFIGVYLAGIDGVRDYFTTAYPFHAALWPGYPDNASIQGFGTRLFGPSSWRPRPLYDLPVLTRVFTISGWIVTVALLFWRLSQSRFLLERLDREFVAVSIASLLLIPVIWPHYYVLLSAPVVILGTYFVNRRSWIQLTLLVISLLVLCLPREFAQIDAAPRLLRTMGAVQFPALLTLYGLALASLSPSSYPTLTEHLDQSHEV